MKKTEAPLISIVMPAYNAEKFIRESINSVLMQTYKNWQLIIVDDGSADSTTKIVNSFKDSRIILIKQNHLGVSVARNQGIKISQGEWVAFLDSDDIWHKNKLKRQVKNINNYNFLFSRAWFIKNKNKLGLTRNLDKIPKKRYAALAELIKSNFINLGSVLFKKDIINQYFDTELSIGEDYDLWLRILSNPNVRIMADNMPLLGYRVHSESTMSNTDKLEYSLAFILHNFSKNQKGEIKELSEKKASDHFIGFYDNKIKNKISLSDKIALVSFSLKFKINLKTRVKIIYNIATS